MIVKVDVSAKGTFEIYLDEERTDNENRSIKPVFHTSRR